MASSGWGWATITKTRFLAGAKHTSRQQVLRLDREPAEPPDPALARQLHERVAEVDAHVDAWVASDYGYGGFDEELRALLRRIASRKPVLVDSRWALDAFCGMTVVKPNEEEAVLLARRLGIGDRDVEAMARGLAERLDARAVVITLGHAGMVVACDGRAVRIPAFGTDEIVDLTGAGDSVAAALTTALAAGADMESAARLANIAGGVVVMKEGAATVSPKELRAALYRLAAERTGDRT